LLKRPEVKKEAKAKQNKPTDQQEKTTKKKKHDKA